MSADMTLYVMKAHTATWYENLAFAVKPYSIALYEAIDRMAKQDKKQAEVLYSDTESANEWYVEPIQLYPLHIEDDLDRDPADTANIAVNLLLGSEKYMGEIMTQHDRRGYADISAYRRSILLRIQAYLKDGSIFGQGSAGAWWHCNECGYLHQEKRPDRYAPEACAVCGAERGSFVRHHEIGGW